MDFQALFDAIGAASRDTRKNYHLTLGGLVEALKGAEADAIVRFDVGGSPTSPHSYRGYYDDLSFEAAAEPVTVERLLVGAENCIGRTFEGYKGGDFLMDAETPLWLAPYGCTGFAMVGISAQDGNLVIATKSMD
jgi:hypothetical protein